MINILSNRETLGPGSNPSEEKCMNLVMSIFEQKCLVNSAGGSELTGLESRCFKLDG